MATLSAQETEFIKTGGTMAVAGYGKTPPGSGWVQLTDANNSKIMAATDSGFQANVWVNSSTQQIWVGIAGTNDVKDAKAWIGAEVGWSAAPDQFRDALKFGSDLKNFIESTPQYSPRRADSFTVRRMKTMRR